MAYNITTTDLRSIGGPEIGYVYDTLVVRIDIATQNVLFLWNPPAYLPINSTRASLDGTGLNASNPFDWFHTNSVEPFEDHFLSMAGIIGLHI